jgi:hypothetical protein
VKVELYSPPQIENKTKQSERLLRSQAAVRRVKKAKLNDLYFSSSVKDLIFNDGSTTRNSALTLLSKSVHVE